MKTLLLAAALCLPLVAQAAEKSELNTAEAIQRITLARQAIKLDPPRDALLDSALASHPMFNQVFASLNEAQLNEAAAMLMAEQFSSKELNALVSFQSSPEGKSIRAKMPAYQKLLGATMQNYLSVAFQKIVAAQGTAGASNLPLNGGTSSSLPPMQVPSAPAETAPEGAGTPLKPTK